MDNTVATWSIVMVSDGDGLYDGHATIVTEGAGPVATSDQILLHHAAAIEVAINALTLLQRPEHATKPATIRATPIVAACIGGVDKETARHYHRLQRAWRLAAATRSNNLWLTCATPAQNTVWADRAQQIATFCLPSAPLGQAEKAWGPLAALFSPNCPLARDPDPDECCVCYEEFDDMFPRAPGNGKDCSRTIPGMFQCGHATCRDCDRYLQSRNQRCPLCRAPRANWVRLRP